MRLGAVAFAICCVLLFARHFRYITYAPASQLDLGEAPQKQPDPLATSTSAIAVESTIAPSPSPSPTAQDGSAEATPGPGSKVIVMAKLEKENTDWVAEFLPE